MSKNHIEYLLLWHLNRFGWIELPGIARLEAQEEAAFIDHIQGEIHPSKIKILLASEEQMKADLFVRHVMEETGYTREKVENDLSKYCLTLSERLKKNTVVKNAFGQWTKKENKISFIQNSLNLHEHFFGLETQALKAIVFHEQPKTVGPQTQLQEDLIKRSTENTTTTTNFLSENRFLLYALGLLWIVFLFLLFCPSKRSTGDLSNGKNSKADSFKTNKDNTVNIAQTDSSKIAITKDTNPTPLQNESQNQIPPDSSLVGDSSASKLDNEVKIADSKVDELNKRIQNKNCIIIIGSFLKKSNANRLAQRVNRNGYNAYQASHNEYHRVGVRFDCFKQDLKEVLQELKQKYSPDSWILKY